MNFKNCIIKEISFIDFMHYKGYCYGDLVIGHNSSIDKYTGEFRVIIRVKDMKSGKNERYRICINKENLGNQGSYIGLVHEIMLGIRTAGYKVFGEDIIHSIKDEYEEIANLMFDDIIQVYEPIYMSEHKLYLGDHMFDVLENFYKLQ